MISKKLHFALLTVAIFTFSCRESKKIDDTNSTLLETEQLAEKPIDIFGIEGENIPVRVGPGKKFDKKINEKATKSLGTAQYCEVDYSVKVKVLEVKGDWSKIEIIEPDWLKDTHTGWIPSKDIKTGKEKVIDFKLKESDYEILRTNHNSNVQNFDVLIKYTKFDKEYLHQFTQHFRAEKCTMGCNINLYDSKAIIDLLGVYPLNKNQYLKIADHFLSMSGFDAVDIKSWYPYHDFQYKKYGGKNWKKEK
jgi:hypothetical protein